MRMPVSNRGKNSADTHTHKYVRALASRSHRGKRIGMIVQEVHRAPGHDQRRAAAWARKRSQDGKTTNHKAVAVKLLIRLIYASNAKSVRFEDHVPHIGNVVWLFLDNCLNAYKHAYIFNTATFFVSYILLSNSLSSDFNLQNSTKNDTHTHNGAKTCCRSGPSTTPCFKLIPPSICFFVVVVVVVVFVDRFGPRMKRYLRYDANTTKNLGKNRYKQLQQYAPRGVNTYGVCVYVCAQQNSALVKQKSFMRIDGGKSCWRKTCVKKNTSWRNVVLRCQLAIGSVSSYCWRDSF